MSLCQFQVLNFGAEKVKAVKILENLTKFNLELPSLRYEISPWLTSIKLNSGRGKNPILYKLYIPKYNEYEAEIFRECTSTSLI